jgi:archaellum component FlaC
MDNNNLLYILIVIAASFVIQAGIMVALFLAVLKSSARMEALATEVKTKALPTMEAAQSFLTDVRPKVEIILENVTNTTSMVRNQMQRLDATVTDVVDRTRLQVIRADELVSRTLDKVEQTTEVVHHTVVSPIRQVSGLVQGVTAGVQYFLGRRRNARPREGMGVPQDELFI